MDDKKYGQIFEKRDVKIFKKIHFARIRAQNEFSFEKKKESIYGKAIWPRPRLPPQPRPLFAIEAGNFFREIDPENDMFLFYFRETIKK